MSQGVFLLLLLAGHALGDFYIQSPNTEDTKTKQPKLIFLSALIYIIIMIFIISAVTPFSIWNIVIALILIAIIYIIHVITDLIEKLSKKTNDYNIKNNSDTKFICFNIKYIFFFIQAIRILLLVILSYLFCVFFTSNAIGEFFISWKNTLPDVISTRLLALTVAVLYLIQPSGTAISIFLSSGIINKSQKESQDTTGFKNAGAIIGVLERLLIFVLLLIGQYSAIGFVFTAKSVARFAEINNQRLEAEHYLIGTFLSLLSVGGITLIIQLFY